MKNRRNYYRILHVQPDAPAAIIKSSYRTLMQKLKAHPDLGGDDWNAALINEAFSVVMDPAGRARYDAELRLQAHRRTPDAEAATGAPDPAPAELQGDWTGPGHPCPFCQTPQPSSQHYGPEDTCPDCRSPLLRPLRVALEGSCKRAVSRVHREGAVRIFTHWPQPDPHPGFIIDLSPNGSKIGSTLHLPPGSVIKVEGELLSAVARVVSCLRSQNAGMAFHLGTEFLTLAFARTRGTFLSARI